MTPPGNGLKVSESPGNAVGPGPFPGRKAGGRIAMRELTATPLLDDLGFAEAPRWHEGRLWFSDIVRQRICRASDDGSCETVLQLDVDPSGLGWMPDGSLLIVSMAAHEILRWRDDQLTLHARTAPLSRARLNDMVVDANGGAYASNFGFDFESGEAVRATNLVRIEPDGTVSAAATDILCPNGMALSPDGERLYVGQSASREVLEFRVEEDGFLCDRDVFATLPEGCMSDGICLDAAEGLWIASPVSHAFLRIERGGQVTHRIDTQDRHAIACVLGGEGRRTLYCLTSPVMSLHRARTEQAGRIDQVQVEIPGVGIP